MVVIPLMKKLSALGIILSLNKSKMKELLYDAPNGVMTDEIKQEIKDNKARIITCIYQQQIQKLSIPESWKLALVETLESSQLSKITNDRWQAIINQIHLWLNQNSNQLQKIIADGWTIQNIFGCHKLYHEQRTDRMGLLMLIHGKTIEEVQMGAISLKTLSGAEQCFYKNILSSPEDVLIYSLEQGLETIEVNASIPSSNSLSFTATPGAVGG